MSAMISCLCGYRGAGIADGAALVCPICRTPAGGGSAASPPPATAVTSAPMFAPAAAPAPASGLRMPPPPTAQPQPVRDAAPAAEPVAAAAAPAGGSPDGILRIPCPNGHVLKTRRAMLGQQIVCPACNESFVLDESASIEYRQEAARRRAREDEERAQKWLWRAIYAAIFIVLSFIVMAVIGSNPQWFR